MSDLLGCYPSYSEKFNPIQILTSMFVHSDDPFHFIFNIVLILFFAPSVEMKIGFKKIIISYLLCGLIGFLFVNYSYHENKILIEKELTEERIIINEIIMVNDRVSQEYLESITDENIREKVKKYNHITSKTYGASAALFGFIIMFFFYSRISLKTSLIYLLGLYCIVDNLLIVFSNEVLLDGGAFAHLGGMIGALILIVFFKINRMKST